MKLHRIIVPVYDIESSARFYSALFELPGIRVSPGRHYFNLDDVIVALYSPTDDGDAPGKRWVYHENQYLYFGVANLEGLHGKLLSMGCQHIDAEIMDMPWGERLFYAIDPFGTPLCFVDRSTLFFGDAVVP